MGLLNRCEVCEASCPGDDERRIRTEPRVPNRWATLQGSISLAPKLCQSRFSV